MLGYEQDQQIACDCTRWTGRQAFDWLVLADCAGIEALCRLMVQASAGQCRPVQGKECEVCGDNQCHACQISRQAHLEGLECL